MDPKKASGTTAFVVVFASFAGFLGHAAVGSIDMTLLFFASAASIAGAILGANLMSSKLKNSQVKSVVGGVLYVAALKNCLGPSLNKRRRNDRLGVVAPTDCGVMRTPR